MKKSILSFLVSVTILCSLIVISSTYVEASDFEKKKVDGSYLTLEDSSKGTSSDGLAKGKHMMTGECSISKAGTKRIYAFGSTTANHDVDFLAVIVYVDQYNEETDEWWQIDYWVEESFNDNYMSTAKSVKVDRGYYYRVRANHIAGDEYPYEETVSFTNGIFVP